MEALKVRRIPLRAAFTKAYNSLHEHLNESELSSDVLLSSPEILEDKGIRLQQLDEEILDLLSKSKEVSQEEYTKEFESCETYKEKLIAGRMKVKQVTVKMEKNLLTHASVNETRTVDSRATATNLKLPKINLIEFTGDPREWLNFWNTFSKIHEDPVLDDHLKFVYLIQATAAKSKAREIVQSFPTTKENYPKVIEHLKNRFGREDILIQVYVRDLLNLVLINNSATKKDFTLSSLYDSLETKLRALESLGVTEDKYASVIFPLVESCLPPDILRIWERERESSSKQGKSDLESILQFLKNEVISEDRIKLARFSFDKSKKSKGCINDESNIPTCNDLYTGDKFKEKAPIKKVEESCLFCDKPHLTEKCFKASTLTYQDKKDLIFKKGACLLCLKKNHISRNCKSKVKCLICQKRHLAVMCQQVPFQLKETKQIEPADAKNEVNVLASRSASSDVLLQTLIVRVKNGNKERIVRGIIDTGCENSYLCKDIIDSLKCNSVSEVKLVHKLFGGVETKEKLHSKYIIHLSSLDNKYVCSVHCLSESVICSDVKKIPKGPWLEELRKLNIQVSDIEGNTPENESDIKLLIGSDIAGKLFTGNIKCLQSGPVAMQTRLGWILMGKIPAKEASGINESLACVSLLLNEKSAENLWKLDVIGINDPVESKKKAEIHEETMQYFEENLNLDSDGRYETALPWVLDPSRLSSNKELAEKRLTNTRRKLLDSNQIKVYQEVLDTWLKDRIIEEVTEGEVGREHYLPHRPVFKESSETTRVRPVFDASAHLKGELSLNDCLEKGPNLIEIIPTLLNRFRKYPIAVISDIEKAFLQIGIREKDRDYLRFLWKGAEGENTKIYRHCRVVFGLTCSPFLLAATLNYHLNRAPDQFAATANILKESFYVDNCLTSFKSVEELNRFVLESRMLLSLAKFNLRGWQSNCETEIISNSKLDTSVCVLGLNWDLKDDTLSCKIESVKKEEIIASKRTLLSCAHKLFDPVGFISPVTLFPKLILQECWKLRLNWDQKLPEHLEKKSMKWVQELELLSDVKIPRWLNIDRSVDEDVSLHIFSDASKHAYATCIFLRVKTESKVYLNFVQARTRVAPLKNTSIPRLELLACLIGARLGRVVFSNLNMPNLRTFFWTDSTTALCWIQRDVRWGTFVWNRVQEIRTLSKIEDWHYIPSELNAADLPSRGCSVKQFLLSKWWEGPSWLLEPESSWSKSTDSPDEEVINSEKRKSVLTTLNKDSKPDNWYYRYFSSIKKIVRMLGWIFRFYFKLRRVTNETSKNLSVSEIERAKIALMLLIQRESFKGVNDDKIKNLRPIVDRDGLIRAKTNISYRDDTDEFKFPVILPADHAVVKLLIMNAHNELLHAGTSMVMSHLREKYWILRARKTVRNCIRKCVKCQRFKSKSCDVTPGILPKDRVRDANIFEIVGVDLAGPLYLKDGRKAYIVLYTCAVYRAIHLELITSLTTEAFFQSLRRFISRRGRPSTIYSDNGSNFKGAESLLHTLDWESLSLKAAEQRIQWKFIPPSAPWWGGWWERLIQMVKQILRKVLGRAALDYEELVTVLCDCERVINTRPLTYVSEDIEDSSPLTPEMFLRGISKSGVPDIDILDKEKLSKRAKYLQKVREQLRARFRVEYLGQLRQQSIKNSTAKPLQIGEIVPLEDCVKKRAFWNLARVIKLIPGRDGQIRLALVKTETSEFLRPVQRLYRLELDNPVQKDMTENIPMTTSSGRTVKPVV